MKKKVRLEISRKRFFGIKNRRGSHLDVVLSFTIFIVFLGFLYSVIGPIKISRDKENILDYLETELKEKLSENLTSASIIIQGVYARDCFEIRHIVDFGAGTDMIVKFKNNSLVKFGEGEQPEYFRIDATPGERFFRIYYSNEEFKDTPLDEACPFAPSTYYSEAANYGNNTFKQTGLVRTEKYIFQGKIGEILGDDDKYEELKGSLNIPKETGFSFGFKFVDSEIPKRNVPTTTDNIYIRDVSVQYIDDEANIKQGVLNLAVW